MESNDAKLLFVNKFKLTKEDLSLQLVKMWSTKGLMKFSEFKEMFTDIGSISPEHWTGDRDLKIIVEYLCDPETIKNYLTIMFYYFKLYIHSDIYHYTTMRDLYTKLMTALEYYSDNNPNIKEDLKFIRDINQILDVTEINNNNSNINNIDSDTLRVNVITSMLHYNSSLLFNLKGEQDFIFKFIIKSGISIFKIQDFEYLASFDNYFKDTNENILLAKKFYIDHHKDHLNFIIGTFHRLLKSEVDRILDQRYAKLSTASAYKIFNSLSDEQLISRSIIMKLIKYIESDVSTFIFVNIYTQRKLPIQDRINTHILVLVNNCKAQWYSMTENCYNGFRCQYMDRNTKVPSLHLLAPNPLDLIFQALTSLYKHNQNNTKFISIIFYVLDKYNLSSKYMIKVVDPYIHLFKCEYFTRNITNINIDSLGFWAHVSHLCTPQTLGRIFRSALGDGLSDFKSMVESFRISEHKNKNLIWKQFTYLFIYNFGAKILKYALESNHFDFIYIILEYIFNKSPRDFVKEIDNQDRIVARLLDILKKNQIREFNKLISEIIVLPQINFLLDDKIYGEILQYFPKTIKEYHPLTTPNYLVLQEIFKYLIFDRESTSKWKVELSTTSKQVHSIISTIFSNYPIESLEIKQTIKHIGSQYCLFKSPPLHLNHHELSFIPIEYFTICTDRLESLSHQLNIHPIHNIHSFRYKNLRYLNIFECTRRMCTCDATEVANQVKLILEYFDNKRIECITFRISALSFGLLEDYKQKKPHVYIDVNYKLHFGHSLYPQNYMLTSLHMIKTLEISSRDLNRLPCIFDSIKRMVFTYEVNVDQRNYTELIQDIQQLINLISAADNFKTIQYLEVYIHITFGHKLYSFFNGYNINTYDIDFKEFKPIIELNTNAIFRFYR